MRFRFLCKLLFIALPVLIYIAGCSIHPFNDRNESRYQGSYFGDTYFYPKDSPGSTPGSRWIAEQMDKYHNSFDVYSDFDSGGNNFVVKAGMGVYSNININEFWTNDQNSGDSSIKVIFTPSTAVNSNGMFLSGTIEDGITPDTMTIVVVSEAIPHLALLDLTNFYSNSLVFAENNHRLSNSSSSSSYPASSSSSSSASSIAYKALVTMSGSGSTSSGYSLYDFNTDKDGAWFEGTAAMALAYKYYNSPKYWAAYYGTIYSGNGPNWGVYAASKDLVTTGWLDYNLTNLYKFKRQSIAATAWVLLAEKAKNPLWIGTTNENIGTAGNGYASYHYQYLTNIMDQYHRELFIYDDANSGGNNFVQRTGMGSFSLITNNDEWTNSPYSGRSCIRIRITDYLTGIYAGLPNINGVWNGQYFMNGVIEGTNLGPSANWGEKTNAGFDLTGATKLTFYAKTDPINGYVYGGHYKFFMCGVGHVSGSWETNAWYPVYTGLTNTNINTNYFSTNGSGETNYSVGPDMFTNIITNYYACYTNVLYPYPDSQKAVLAESGITNVQLTTSWQKFTIYLTNADLNYVLGGFGWSTFDWGYATRYFYLDKISIDKPRLSSPRFLNSYTTVNSTNSFDTVLANTAYTYDNAIALLAFLAYGDNTRAQLIADALVYAQNHDRAFTDNRLRNAYSSGELIVPPGWRGNGISNTVRMPGWWNAAHDVWYEDRYAVGTSCDTMAWAMIALLSYYQKVGGNEYLDAAKKMGDWVENNLKDTRGDGGYKNGFTGWEGNQTADNGKSTTANSALYAAFTRLYQITSESKWQSRATAARQFVLSMWTKPSGGGFYFMNGILTNTNNNKAMPNWGVVPNAGIDLSGATKLEFYAKGQNGGERVEFFCGGLGRDALQSGQQAPYPDSMPKASSGILVLNNSWTKYTIDLTGRDLKYIQGGFGFWCATTNQISFYLDDVRYNQSRLDDPRFIASFMVDQRLAPFDGTNSADQVLKATSFVYDNAMSVLAFLAVGENLRAQQICDAIVYAMNHDRSYTDGRLRNGYSSGELKQWPGWYANGKTNAVRLPGWWVIASNTYYEDKYAVSTSTGNMAWAMLALISYYQKCGGQAYLDAAKTMGDWIHSNLWNGSGRPGYQGGFDGWEPSPTKFSWKSTEHNTDLYAVFTRLYQITGESKWAQRATNAFTFVTNMWQDGSNWFYTGTTSDGATIDYNAPIPLDMQVWTHLSLRDLLSGKYTNSFATAENMHRIVSNNNAWGFDFDTDRDGMWFEGTGQMATGYLLVYQKSKWTNVMTAINEIGRQADNGIFAATKDGLTTGFEASAGIPWYYYKREAVGATTWSVIAEKKVNPFWIGTAYENLDIWITNQYSFGIYTETSAHRNVSYFPWNAGGELYVWNNTVTVTELGTGQYEGNSNYQWTIGNQGWMGGGMIFTNAVTNLSYWQNGWLNFKIKTSSAVRFKAGIRSFSGSAQEAWVNLVNYGMQTNGSWVTINIPIADFKAANPSLNLDNIDYAFMIAQQNGTSVSSGQVFYLDDIYWYNMSIE